MGLVKTAWMEDQARGWSDPETYVCDACMREPYLSQLIRDHAESEECNYCDRSGGVVAPAAVVIEAIASAVFHFYADPTDAGVPYDGGFIVEPIYTNEVLQGFSFDCDDDFFQAIEESLDSGGAAWVPAVRGHWNGLHTADQMEGSWMSFVHLVKHETRFHFFNRMPEDREDVTPLELLGQIGRAVDHLQATRTLNAGTVLYRVRLRNPGPEWEPTAATMGAPPKGASAGRMNPAGISYFYCALEQATALAEVIASPPVDLVVAAFDLTKDIVVLDLCDLPPSPSIFDPDNRDEFQWLAFLRSFARAISEPVRKDGSEHVDYVPSQVVCEWFAQVFDLGKGGERLDGILYPSALMPGGKNLVVFPDRRNYGREFSLISFRRFDEHSLKNWAQIAEALGFRTARQRAG